MENDVQLLQKLLTLGETIQDLRRHQDPEEDSILKFTESAHIASGRRSATSVSTSSSAPSTRSSSPLSKDGPRSPQIAEVTNLYVDDGEKDEDAKEALPSIQYFSRKNSVLRIPIPPRSSNRLQARRYSVGIYGLKVFEK